MRIIAKSLAVSSWILLLAAVAGPEATARKAKGAIAGTIRDTSGLPVAGGEVIALTAAGKRVRKTTSDVAGSYRLTRLRAGKYYVCARGYRHLPQCYDRAPSLQGAILVEVGAGKTVSGIDFELQRETTP